MRITLYIIFGLPQKKRANEGPNYINGIYITSLRWYYPVHKQYKPLDLTVCVRSRRQVRGVGKLHRAFLSASARKHPHI